MNPVLRSLQAGAEKPAGGALFFKLRAACATVSEGLRRFGDIDDVSPRRSTNSTEKSCSAGKPWPPQRSITDLFKPGVFDRILCVPSALVTGRCLVDGRQQALDELSSQPLLL